MPQPKLFERLVTQAEANKDHITIPTYAHNLFEDFFGPVAKENTNNDQQKPFYEAVEAPPRYFKLCRRNDTLNPDGTIKTKRNELRLYIRNFCVANEILVIKFRDGKALISKKNSKLLKPNAIYPPGARRSSKIKVTSSQSQQEQKYEAESDTLNKALQNKDPKTFTQKEKQVWIRSRSLANKCLKLADYKCEAGYETPFLSSRTKKPLLEVHHFIPQMFQEQFRGNLDCIENLCCLSPNVHRALHYGTSANIRELLNLILDHKTDALEKFGIGFDTLYRFYGAD